MATSSSSMPIDPDAGIPDLIRRLADDSKRLALDEVRLAKLELRDNVHAGARGTVRLAIAFGAAVVALVGLTIGLSALLGRVLGNYWAGTLVVAVLELGVAYLLVRRGLEKMKEPEYTFPESRAALAETAQWVKTAREPEVVDRNALEARDEVARVATLTRGLPERAD